MDQFKPSLVRIALSGNPKWMAWWPDVVLLSEILRERKKASFGKVEYGELGNTGWKVSRVALGTVELGVDYGFRNSTRYRRPEPDEAIRVIHCALDRGVNLVDTARGYGNSEELIGKALKEKPGGHPLIASKVVIPTRLPGDGLDMRRTIFTSIEFSLRALQVETLDLLQIHNTSLAILRDEEAMRALEDAQAQGKIRLLGASSDDEEASLEALNTATICSLQTPFNLLNRTILSRVLPRAADCGAGVLVRSAFLRGILTGNLDSTPPELSGLRKAALRVWEQFDDEVGSLSQLALRFCLSFAEVSSVVIGVRSVDELEANLSDASRGGLSKMQVERLLGEAPPDPSLLDPRQWRAVI